MIDYEKLAIASPSERTKMVKEYIYDTYKTDTVVLYGQEILDEYFEGNKYIQLDINEILTKLLDKDDKKLLEANK